MILICVASALLAFRPVPLEAVIPEPTAIEIALGSYAIADHAKRAPSPVKSRRRIIGKTHHGNVVPGWVV